MFDRLKELLEAIGIDSKYIIILMLVAVAIPTFQAIWKGIKFIILKRNQRKLNKDLTPYFTANDVGKATKYYISTKYQNVSPSEDEELGRKYIASAKNELIPLFLKKAFKNDADDNKYYLILADTGMGKTTFMVNLFLQYKNQISFLAVKYDISLFPLGSPDVLEIIQKIENKKNNILLLDAFDEDIKAVEDYKNRMHVILSVAKDFREIVITCRTQFFPSEEEEPYRTGYYSFGDGNNEYNFQKLYLSIFDEKDVRKYLKKRFSIFQFGKRKSAFEIVKKSPNLAVRPMVLSNINDLVDSNVEFNHSFEVYEVLIDKWIERESRKRGIREKYGSETYKKLLYEFSQDLAINLYEKRKERGGYFIPKGVEISETLKFEEIGNYAESEKDLKSKSLLTRNTIGQYKFAHRSIFEYFLARKMFETPLFLSTFDFDGMTSSKTFYYEILFEKMFNIYGNFSLEDNKIKPFSQLRPKTLREVRRLKISKLENFEPLYLLGLDSLSELVVFDKEKYQLLYNFYVVWSYYGLSELQGLNEF